MRTNVLRSLAVLLAPAVAVLLFYFILLDSSDIRMPFIALHLLTAAWVAGCFRLRLCRASLLPLSFAVSIVGPYLYDMQHPGFLQYAGTGIVLIVYAFPWTALTLIAAAVVLVRRRRSDALNIEEG